MLAIAALLLVAPAALAAPITFTVNNNGDQADSNVGNGICDVGGGVCTLRAAIQEANANSAQADTINFSGVTGQILLTSALPAITDSVTINGPGADQLAIDGADTFRVLEAQSGATTSISGLTIRHGQGPVSGGDTFANAGGILSGGDMTLDHVVVSDNHAAVTGAADSLVEAVGGGIESGGGTFTLTHSTVKDNDATAVTSGTGQAFTHGGGVAIDGGVFNIDHSTINDNLSSTAINSGSGDSTTQPNGGGIYQADATLTIDESTITGNTATGSGGTSTIIADFAMGGGVSQDNGSSLTMSGSTVSGNSTIVPTAPHEFTNGANVMLLTGGTFEDTIVANPSGGPNCGQSAPDFVSNGYNLEDDTSPASTCNFTQTTDISGHDPMLGPLAPNGGPTQTMKLFPGSPAIDKGKSFGGAITDQRGTGFPRISDSPTINNAAGGDGSDIGAFERDSVAPHKPAILASTPKSPANNNNPKLKGLAEAGSTVRIYKTANCTGTAVKMGSASTFSSPGLPVNVPNNSSTVFHATATDASNNKSDCSNGFSYVEDSTPPTTTINSVKKAPNYHTAKVLFSSNEVGATFKCKLDAQPYASCSSPRTYTGLAAGQHTVRVVATDRAGNTDATPAVQAFTL